MADTYTRFPSGGVATYSTFAAFPASAANGTLALALDTDFLYAYNTTSNMWVLIAGASSVLSVGPLDSQSPSADGAVIHLNNLIMQSASASVAGLVNTVGQTFAGIKNFNSNIFAANLSGTNSGDITLGIANGLSLAGQALSLGLSSTSTTGALSSTDWNTFNNKQGPLTLGNLTDVGTDGIVVTGGTGAVVGSGTSIAQHVADATHNGYLSSADWTTFNSKANNPSATSMQEVYVLANGNDTTGDGTFSNPYLTISKALSTITTASSTARFAVMVGPKNLAEPVFNLKPYVWIIGVTRGATRIQVSSGSIGLDPSFASTTARCGMQNILISGTNNQLNFDLQTIGGVGFSCVVELNTVHVNGLLTWKARTSADVAEIWQCQFLGNVALSAGNVLLFNSYIPSNISGNVSGSTDSSTFVLNHNTVEGSISISEASHALSVEVLGTALTGTLTLDGAQVTGVTDLCSSTGLTVTNSATVTYKQGILPIANGGTGAVTQQAAINSLTGSQSSGTYLRSNGTNAILTAIQAADVPTLNQNTTGSAGSVSGTNVITNSNLAQMAAHTFKGNNTGSTANALDLTISQMQAELIPLTTKGDLLAFSTVNARLPVGGNGQVLTADSTQTLGVKWAPSASPSFVAPLITTYTTGAATGTHTFTGSPLYVRVRMVGGGGGGSGSATIGGGTGTSGTASTFGTSLLSAGGGAGGIFTGQGAGGSASLGTGPTGLALSGGDGGLGVATTPAGVFVDAMGGISPFFAGYGPVTQTTGGSAKANTGGGGAGGATNGAASVTGGTGGGSGAYVDAIISGSTLSGLAGSASYQVGNKGTGGTNGTLGNLGGDGGTGMIEVTEYYQ